MGLIPIEHVGLGFDVNDGFVVFDRRDKKKPKRVHIYQEAMTIDRLARVGCRLMFDPDYKRQYCRDVLAELYKVEGITPELIGQLMAREIEFDWNHSKKVQMRRTTSRHSLAKPAHLCRLQARD